MLNKLNVSSVDFFCGLKYQRFRVLHLAAAALSAAQLGPQGGVHQLCRRDRPGAGAEGPGSVGHRDTPATSATETPAEPAAAEPAEPSSEPQT